jgi:hypothetical protein
MEASRLEAQVQQDDFSTEKGHLSNSLSIAA